MGRSVRNGVGRCSSGVSVGRIPKSKTVDVGPSSDDFINQSSGPGTHLVNTRGHQIVKRRKK